MRMSAERSLPPDQQAAARHLRDAERFNDFCETNRRRTARDRERVEKREGEAVGSTRLDALVVSNAALKYLQEKEAFEGCKDVLDAAEKILFMMMLDPKTAVKVSNLLDRWHKWVNRGGMNKEDFGVIKVDLTIFTYVVCLMGMLRMQTSRKESTLALDLQECIKTWKKARVG